ncbi:MAG: hypothetical protein RI920_370, partial [Pseudomonadota bacterium]
RKLAQRLEGAKPPSKATPDLIQEVQA